MWKTALLVLTVVQLLGIGSCTPNDYFNRLKEIDVSDLGDVDESEETLEKSLIFWSKNEVLELLEEVFEPPDALGNLTRETSISYTCIRDTKRFIDGVKRNETWAFKMADAAGKPRAGILRGHLKWYGSFDECLNTTALGAVNTSEPEVLYKGRYCSLTGFRKKDANRIKQLTEFDIDQPPIIILGACLPETCDSYTAAVMANMFVESKKLPLFVVANCQEREHDLDAKAIVAICIVGVWVTLVICGTAYDIVYVQRPKWNQQSPSLESMGGHGGSVSSPNRSEAEEKLPLLSGPVTPYVLKDEKTETKDANDEDALRGTWERLLLSFSAYTNGARLLDTRQSEGTLTAVEGIRFLSITWIILSHWILYLNLYSQNRKTYVSDLVSRWNGQMILNGSLAVDTFFTISGVLTGYLVLRAMNRGRGKINWIMYYIHRFFRLTPVYMFILMVYVCLIHYFSDGPLWPIDGLQIDDCRDNWWKNLLYVNNVVNRDNICMPWSWFLASDMQFYIISPIILVPLYFCEWLGFGVLVLLLAGTMVTAGVVTKTNDIPSGIGTEVDGYTNGMKDYIDYYYTPYCRIGPYLVGVAVGHILQKTQCKIQMNTLVVIGGWCVAAASALAVLFGPHDAANGTPMTPEVNAFYNAVHTSVWGLAVSWVIFTCATGYSGCVNSFLSWKIFVPLSRLTYCAYLVHPMIICFWILSQRAAPYISDINLIFFFSASLVETYLAATFAYLVVEVPFSNMEKVLLKKRPRDLNNRKDSP